MNKLLSILVIFLIQIAHANNSIQSVNNRLFPDRSGIKLTIELPKTVKDSLTIYYRNNSTDSISYGYKAVKSAVRKGIATFTINSTVPIILYTPRTFFKVMNWVAEPADNIRIQITDSNMIFSGKGSEKFTMQVELDSATRSIPQPSNPNNFKTENLRDFLTAHEYINKRMTACLSIIDRYRSKLSPFVYNSVRVGMIKRLQENRLDKFGGLRNLALKQEITNNDLCIIFDSCFNSTEWKWALSQHEYFGGWYAYVRAVVGREHGFDYTSDSMKDDGKRRILYYNRGIQLFSGRSQELFLVDLVTNEGIGELGFTPEIRYLLSRYYSEPRPASLKAYVRLYEEKVKKIKTGSLAPNFLLTDQFGQTASLQDYAGKVILLDFWFTGCTGCMQMAPIVDKLIQEFDGDTNVVFLSVSTDRIKTKWIKSIQDSKYTSSSGTHLFTNGEGSDHDIIKDYNISAYPSIFLIGENGRIIENPLPDPRDDNGSHIKSLIIEQLANLNDGPYIFFTNDSPEIYSFKRNQLQYTPKPLAATAVEATIGQTNISIPLKPKHYPEPSSYAASEKILAISDIEGNLKAFTQLLKTNKVIDEKLSWTYGDGHLVLLGDFFDRGEQVTECLWLIYSLEEQAKQMGGYVHFILGNHEIMNLKGDARYVQRKYINNASKIKIPYGSLFGKQTELGRWLRSKNIMERIGKVLFVHGGISQEVNQLPLTLEQMNNLVRNSIDQEISSDSITAILYSSKTSPFWYRLYYQASEERVSAIGEISRKASSHQIDETCKKFNVNKIITGHTIVGQKINAHYGGKVINIDTDHASGYSQALLLLQNQLHTTDQSGTIKPLITPAR